jgi:hypothetical protein
MTRPRDAYSTPHRLRSAARFGSALLVVLALAVLGPLATASSAGAHELSSGTASTAFASASLGDDERDCKPWEDWCRDDDKCHPWWKCDDDKKCKPWWKCDDDRSTAPRFRSVIG